jgi:leucyl/phenylalanyl-tRNA--protein transferase
MRACAEPRDGQDGTWITGEMVAAYAALAREGVAHSVEVWNGDALVGGLYGIAIGRMFFGESMFTRESDASKVGLVALVGHLRHWGFELVDCQMSTAHLASLGAREVSRAHFLERVHHLTRLPPVPGPWRLEAAVGDA